MKKHEIIFSIIKLPLDFLIIFLVFFISREIRLITDLIPNIQLPIQTINTINLFPFAFFWSFLYILILSIHWLYSIKIFNSKIKEFLEIIRYSFYTFIFFSVIVYLWNWVIYEIAIPRLIVIFTFIIWTILIILERIILNNLQYYLLKKWIIPKRKLLLINNKEISKINDILKDIKETKIYEIIWYINEKLIPPSRTSSTPFNTKERNNEKLKYLWKIKDIHSLFEEKKCDEILYIDSDFNKKDLFELWELSRIFGIRYRYITNSFDITKTNTTLTLINKIPVIEIKNTPLENWWKVLKRIFDILSWIIWIVLLLPFLFIVSILIKLEDPKWPILYKNKRLGEKGEEFTLYKFRYMKWEYCIKDAYWITEDKDSALKYEELLIKKQNGRKWALYKIKNDPRKTKIWNFIEKYSIDEIPNLLNVILWNMSLVWPRPHQAREVKRYSLEEKRLLTIKPWITWMAQVNWREKNDFKKEAKLDIFYIENWSFLLDFKIILKTFSVIIKRMK